jgi:hypothetical protein
MRKDRSLIKLARKQFNGRRITALEIGVLNGGNAVSILRNLNVVKLYLVDPYEKQDLLFNTMKKRLKKYGNRVEFIRDYSNVLNDFKKFYPLLNTGTVTGSIIGGYAFKPQHRQVVEDAYKIKDEYGLKIVGDFNEWWVVVE